MAELRPALSRGRHVGDDAANPTDYQRLLGIDRFAKMGAGRVNAGKILREDVFLGLADVLAKGFRGDSDLP